jgi:hypothetical protein
MALLSRDDLKYFLILFCIVGAGMFVCLLYGLQGYMTTSARIPYCRAHLPGPELCPLDYVMLSGDFLLIWATFMAIWVLPILLTVAFLVAAIRWLFGRPLWPGEA